MTTDPTRGGPEREHPDPDAPHTPEAPHRPDDFEDEEPTPGSDGDGAESGYTPPSETDLRDPRP